ncbi:MAG TPA: hypothetical protein PKL57_20760, partial [Candidatus Wallbacteria bacterium]|nr:hypothetical protein [Candidatus Wallbacteria bacterium]
MNALKKKGSLLYICMLLLASLFSADVNAYADASLAGPTGLFLTPSPAVCKPGKFSGGLYLQSYSIQRASSSSERSI